MSFIEQKFYNKFYDKIQKLRKIAQNSPVQHKHSACLIKGNNQEIKDKWKDVKM